MATDVGVNCKVPLFSTHRSTMGPVGMGGGMNMDLTTWRGTEPSHARHTAGNDVCEVACG